MIQHITFANGDMSISGVKCSESALANGCDKTTLYTPRDIDKAFRTKYDDILSEPRGAGYWLWKPYFIEQGLSKLNNGEYLVYTDAGLLFQDNVKHLIASMDSDIMVFGNRWRHGDWCRMDVLKAMGCESETDREQLQASCIILRKSALSVEFVRDWLYFCTLNRYITDDISAIPNEPTFREHRHDQAILTNMAMLYGLTWHWWAAQYSERYKYQYPNDNYPITFQHHRKRNHEWNH
jgi:hypothetical protein